LSAYHIILPAEASANLARYDGIRYRKSVPADKLINRYKNTRALFGPEVKRRILLGTFVLSVGHYDDYYQTALKVQQQIKNEYARVFETIDVLISPTTPTLPFPIGAKAQDPLAMYQSDLLTVSANLAGVPALSLPCGFSQNALPIGAQLIAAQTKDNVILALAKVYQQETDWHLRKPDE
jgi:aspartyl-tRNA(Asn)/glutamyl-tRNA(Gln) amidotransferase subunit A